MLFFALKHYINFYYFTQGNYFTGCIGDEFRYRIEPDKENIYLNGEKQDYDVELVSQDDSQLTYKIKDENGNKYTYQENSNSVEIQADGDVADGEVEVEVSGNGLEIRL